MNVGRSAHSQEAISTVDRSSLGRLERYGGFDRAQRAFYSDLDALSRERLTVGLDVSCDTVILFQLARLTSLRIVSQSLVREEQLLSSAEDKLFAAVYAPQNLVRVLLHWVSSPCSTRAREAHAPIAASVYRVYAVVS